MSISAIGNSYASPGYSSPAGGAASRQTQSSTAQDVGTGLDIGSDTVEQQFLDYMKKSPAERMVDAWLQAHHLTRKDLEAMPPEERDAILKEMARDIKAEVEQKVEARKRGKTDILA